MTRKEFASTLTQEIKRRTSRAELVIITILTIGVAVYTSWSKGIGEGVYALFIQGGSVGFWIVYFGVIGWVAAVWARWDKARADRRIIKANPCYVSLRQELADQYVSDLQVQGEDGRYSRAIFFNPDVLLWCKDELVGDHTVHPPGPDGGRIVTFENPADAFAFKIRWG